jgi:2-dehydro-3-deoxyglucarate aldolase/4-hydroxy-2-oxoheptanedioate aldolase
MGSHFKERLCAPGARLLGMFVKFPSMESIETLASAGYDFIIIDMEHAPLGVETVYRMIAIAERSGMAALVRLRGHETATGGMFLDAGASGVLIPHCSPYAEARELVADLVFPPTGRRGAGGGGRATQWGLDGPEEYRRGGDQGVVRVPMIEDPQAVDDIDQILGLPGVDAAFIGQGDLTQTLGDRQVAQALVDRALAACRARNVPAATTAYADDVEQRLRQGFTWLAIANDTGTFARAAQQRLHQAKQALQAVTG